jgi:Uma2 family endonuclease
MALSQSLPSSPRGQRAYLRQPQPLHFPVEEQVPETKRHLILRTALYQTLERAFGQDAIVCSDQFMYWDPTDPTQCLSPDVALRRGVASPLVDCWKTWELGAPELAIEIVSDDDRSERRFQSKLERYRRAGVAEIVRFDTLAKSRPLRLFDLVSGDMVERDLNANPTDALRCDALGLYWSVRSEPEFGHLLRLARDAEGNELLMTPDEERDAAQQERDAAQARIRELEAELARRR